MRTTNHRSRGRDADLGIGPESSFAAATFACFALWTGGIATFPHGLVMPAVATLLFACATVFAVTAWRQRGADPNRVTYADVSGALVLIGVAAAATIDSDQLVRLVFGNNSEHPTTE